MQPTGSARRLHFLLLHFPLVIMAIVEMVMPKMGESIMEGTILKWLKKPGDRIAAEESVLEVATDKVDTEVPATQAGVLQEILVNEGDVVAVGAPIARINTDVTATQPTPDTPVTPPATVPPTPQEIAPPTPTGPLVEQEEPVKQGTSIERDLAELAANVGGSSYRLNQPAAGRFYSPLVLTIAREEGISMQELEYIPGTGAENRVTKKDILHFVTQRNQNGGGGIQTGGNGQTKHPETPQVEQNQPIEETQPELQPSLVTPPVEGKQPQPVAEKTEKPVAKPAVKETTQPVSPPAASVSGKSDIIEMDRMRKMIAQRMVDSKRISPHVTSFVEADVTNIVYWRNRIKNEFKQREGDAITFTPIFIEAVAKAIKDYPMINVSVDGDKIVVKRNINIGMAVALPSGNLIVPVIHNADQLNLVGLTRKVNDLAKRGRDNKLTADDLSGGTYTTSNVGSFGNVMGTPIILQPQVGILAFGAVRKKPAVIETPTGDTLGIRHLMFLSHSYDHRVVDGSLGGMFVRRVADYLEQFDINRKIF